MYIRQGLVIAANQVVVGQVNYGDRGLNIEDIQYFKDLKEANENNPEVNDAKITIVFSFDHYYVF